MQLTEDMLMCETNGCERHCTHTRIRMQTDHDCVTVKMKLIRYNIVSLITHAGASGRCVGIV
jgi:hypothetical protein